MAAASSLKSGGVFFSMSDSFLLESKRLSSAASSFSRIQFPGTSSGKSSSPVLTSSSSSASASVHTVQASICISKSMRWWEKTLKPNMIEVHSAQELVNYLLDAGDRLVILDFYSPGCGGCKALHPKICQLAELNPDALILKINYEELKRTCHALHVHVLPFFRFYRGAEGKVCSFSCTNATIKKFKDAVAKHGNDRCSLGPAKGLDESDLKKLVEAGEISSDLPVAVPVAAKEEKVEELVMKAIDRSSSSGWGGKAAAAETGMELVR